MTATINPVIDDLVVAVGRNCHIITDPDITAGYRQDQTLVVPGGEPLLVAFPSTIEDAVEVMTPGWIWSIREACRVPPLR